MFKLFRLGRRSVSTVRRPVKQVASPLLEPLEARSLLSANVAAALRPDELAPAPAVAVPAVSAQAVSVKPTATISFPTTDIKYQGGGRVQFSGFGTGRGGKSQAADFTWTATLFADGTTMRLARIQGQRSGSFLIPATLSADPKQFIRVTLTIRDGKARGRTHVDITPRLADLNVQTNFEGLKLIIDGADITSSGTVSTAAGGQRFVAAPKSQVVDGITYAFDRWSDNGARRHSVTVGVGDETLIAFYRPIAVPTSA